MIEIAVLIFGTRHLAKVAQRKGHSGWIAAVFPALWIVAEFFGVIVGIAATGDALAGMGMGLVSAIAGGIVGAVIVHVLPHKELEEDDVVPFGTPVDAKTMQDNVWAG